MPSGERVLPPGHLNDAIAERSIIAGEVRPAKPRPIERIAGSSPVLGWGLDDPRSESPEAHAQRKSDRRDKAVADSASAFEIRAGAVTRGQRVRATMIRPGSYFGLEGYTRPCLYV